MSEREREGEGEREEKHRRRVEKREGMRKKPAE